MASPDSAGNINSVRTSFTTDASVMLSNEPPPKRRKTLLACNHCRARKTRCDGKRPICSACEKRRSGEDCLYEESTLKTQRYIEALENRLDRLEREDTDCFVHLGEPGSRQCNGHSKRKANNLPTLLPLHENDPLNFPGGSNVSATSPTVHHPNVESPDALATVSMSTDHNLLYGPSSTIAFVERVLVATGEIEGLVEPSNHRQDALLEVQGARSSSGLAELDLLPMRRISDSYLKSFWDIVHPVFPILHQQTFMRFYNQLWEPQSPSETLKPAKDSVMLATLNLVLAIGCRFNANVGAGSRAVVADQFYQRARRLVSIDTLDVASIPIVQMLLLTAIHLQSTMYSSRCWNIVGLATRVAQSLGLHLNRSKSGTSQLEREMRRRIWYTCVTLDILLCTTFGRPGMLSNNSTVPLPLMVDDEHLLETGEGTQPTRSECRMGLFVYSAQLFEILSEVLHCFYAEAESTNDDDQETPRLDLHELLRLDSKLDHFLESLPNNLQLQKVSRRLEPPTGAALLQARILYCRFLYTRLLLLRPVVISASKMKADLVAPDSNLGSDVATRMCQVCLDTAHELISVLHGGRGSLYRCSAWWTIYFTFGAATVVLASLLYPNRNTAPLVETSMAMAMDLCRHYAPELESATHAMRVLEHLRGRLSRMANADVVSHGNTLRGEKCNTPQQSFGVGIGNDSHELFPDPLSEDWFLHQSMMNFDIPSDFWQN